MRGRVRTPVRNGLEVNPWRPGFRKGGFGRDSGTATRPEDRSATHHGPSEHLLDLGHLRSLGKGLGESPASLSAIPTRLARRGDSQGAAGIAEQTSSRSEPCRNRTGAPALARPKGRFHP